MNFLKNLQKNIQMTSKAVPRRISSGAWSFPLFSCQLFFCLYLHHYVLAPQFHDLRQHLIDGEHIKLVQPFLNGRWNGVVRMVGHGISHALKNLQVLDLELLTFIPQISISRFSIFYAPSCPGSFSVGRYTDLYQFIYGVSI